MGWCRVWYLFDNTVGIVNYISFHSKKVVNWDTNEQREVITTGKLRIWERNRIKFTVENACYYILGKVIESTHILEVKIQKRT